MEETRGHRWRWPLTIWAIARLPLALYVAYRAFGRALIEADLERGARIIQAVFDIASTPLVRSLWVAVWVAACLVALSLSRRKESWAAFAAVLAAASAVGAAASWFGDQTMLPIAMALVLLALNLFPVSSAALVQPNAGRGWFLGLGIGVVEVFFSRHYLRWLSQLWGVPNPRAAALCVPAFLLSGLVLGVGLTGARLVAVEQRLRTPQDVTLWVRGDFNWIDRDDSGRYLFATGHQQPRLLRFDLQDASAPPVQSDAEIAGSQDFAYDHGSAEILLVNTSTKKLLVFDVNGMRLVRSIDVPQLSGGDPWITFDPESSAVLIVSENDSQSGTPFLLVDRATGEVLDSRNDDAGNLVRHPNRPVAYLSFFRRRTELLAYDLRAREVVARREASQQLSRMAFWLGGNEVLVSSPTNGRVLRFDAETLALRGGIDAGFGVRSLAVDEVRGMLVSGSVATGMLRMIDLRTSEPRGSVYVGPWLRTIELDPARSVAYVSSKSAIYVVNYGALMGEK